MDLNDGISNLSKDIADLKALAAKVLKSEHKVLFVDDESVMLKTYRRMFKDSDFSINISVSNDICFGKFWSNYSN